MMKADAGGEQNPSKQAALAILNMFNTSVVHLINGTNIDGPSNAITLTAFFTRFLITFKFSLNLF